MQNRPYILVLGATGMVGKTVFKYLKSHNKYVLGTARKKNIKNKLIRLTVKDLVRDFEIIIKKYNKFEYVINCIGALKESEPEELIKVNSLFPQCLSKLAVKNNFYLIHISTDAVFCSRCNDTYEDSHTNPCDAYGASKLLGEPTDNNTLIIRTSFLGLNKRKSGLLRWILSNYDKEITGFINQKWSGCTTLQFAQFCNDIIKKEYFNKLKNLSNIFHFVPLGPTSKYQIIKDFLNFKKVNYKLTKGNGVKISRFLKSRYKKYINMNSYGTDMKNAFAKLLEFENGSK